MLSQLSKDFFFQIWSFSALQFHFSSFLYSMSLSFTISWLCSHNLYFKFLNIFTITTFKSLLNTNKWVISFFFLDWFLLRLWITFFCFFVYFKNFWWHVWHWWWFMRWCHRFKKWFWVLFNCKLKLLENYLVPVRYTFIPY